MLEYLFSKLNLPLEPIPTGLKPKLTKLPQIEAVIFDIYGTLVVSGTGDISMRKPSTRKTNFARYSNHPGWS